MLDAMDMNLVPRSLLFVSMLATAACGAGDDSSSTTVLDGESFDQTATGTTSAGSEAESAGTSASGTIGTTADGDTTTDPTAGTDTGAAGLGPTQLYRGPVAGGIVPGWDPEAPRPLLMMGRLGESWQTTLARIGDDGSLSENAAQEIIVWGWEVEPPQLYDGPLGGTLPSWSAATPYPIVLIGERTSDGAWLTTLASIDEAGTLGGTVVNRLIVWGWASAEPAAPSVVYDGPVAGGSLPGWNPDDPVPLVMLARPSGTMDWWATLSSIAADGSLGDNVAEQIVVWGW